MQEFDTPHDIATISDLLSKDIDENSGIEATISCFRDVWDKQDDLELSSAKAIMKLLGIDSDPFISREFLRKNPLIRIQDHNFFMNRNISYEIFQLSQYGDRQRRYLFNEFYKRILNGPHRSEFEFALSQTFDQLSAELQIFSIHNESNLQFGFVIASRRHDQSKVFLIVFDTLEKPDF